MTKKFCDFCGKEITTEIGYYLRIEPFRTKHEIPIFRFEKYDLCSKCYDSTLNPIISKIKKRKNNRR